MFSVSSEVELDSGLFLANTLISPACFSGDFYSHFTLFLTEPLRRSHKPGQFCMNSLISN